MSARRAWIERDAELAVSRQCALAGVARSWVYGAAGGEALDESDLLLLGLIDAQYTRRPFYGSRRMVVYLKEQGHAVNRKRVQRLMRVLGLAGMAPGPRHQPAPPGAQDLPLPAARGGGGAPQPGLEHRHHLHPPGAWLCLPGGHHRLVRPSGARLADLQHPGGGVLRGLPGGRPAYPRQA